jgi:lactaldehyde dehydrogenase/glycolaldehyde dehydrogenase
MRDITNPATLELLGQVPDSSSDQVAKLVSVAHTAQQAWSQTSATSRTAQLGEIGARIRADATELATLLTKETGKPLCESYECIEVVANLFATSGGDALAELVTHSVHAEPRARGVIATLPSFNFPLLQMAAAVVPTLAAGQCIICKPPQHNPLSSLRLASLCDALPSGVLSLVTGGPDTVAALVGDPHVAGCMRYEAGAPGVFIVDRSANLDFAVPSIAWTRLWNAGQAGYLGQHIYVDRAIVAEFVERMHPCVGLLDVDNPLKRPTDLGPLISLEAAHRVEDQVGRSLREGAKLILGGRRFQPSGLPGHFYQPTILTEIRHGSVPMRETIAGPVVTITPIADVREALQLTGVSATESWASIYCGDAESMRQSLQNRTTGRIRINDPNPEPAADPCAALGREMVQQLLDVISKRGAIQSTALRVSPAMGVAPTIAPKPWWFPYGDRCQRGAPGVAR